jgi:hypothetical protein
MTACSPGDARARIPDFLRRIGRARAEREKRYQA